MIWDETLNGKKDLTVIEMWECKGLNLYKTSNNVKNISEKKFLTDIRLQLSK